MGDPEISPLDPLEYIFEIDQALIGRLFQDTNRASEPNSLRGGYYGAMKTTCLGVTDESDITGGAAGGGIALQLFWKCHHVDSGAIWNQALQGGRFQR